MLSNSVALESVIISDFPELKQSQHRHLRWHWYRCIPLALLVTASRRLGLQFGFRRLNRLFDYYIASLQEWLEQPDKTLELGIAYSVIFSSAFVMIMAVANAMIRWHIL